MASRVIDAVLRLQDEFTAPLQKSLTAMTNCSKSAVKIGRDIESTGKKISSVGLGLTAGITLPFVAFGKAAVEASGTYDQSLRLIESTMGDAKFATADLSKAMEDAAEKSVYTLQETADATLAFARAGFNAKEAADMITPALSLAAGTATDIGDVTNGMTAAMKTFSDEGVTASQVADILATAQAQAATDTNQLFEAISTVGPMFNSFGWSIKDLAVATDIFGEAGISGSEGATSLKTSLMNMAAKADTLKTMGADIFDANGNLRSMVEVQEQLHNAFGTLSNDAETLTMLDEIFGKNQGSKMLAFMNAAPDTVKEFRNALDDCTGTADSMANSMMSGPGGAIEQLGSTFDVFKKNVGDSLQTVVQPFVTKLTELLTAFNHLSDEQQANIVKWVGYAAAVGPVLMVFGKAVSTVGTGIQAFNKIGIAIKAAGGIMGILTGPTAIVIAAVAAIGVVIAIVITHFDTFKEAAQSAFEYAAPELEKLKQAFNNFKTIVAPIITVISNLLASVLAGAFEGFMEAGVYCIDAVAGIINGFSDTIQGLVTFVSGLVEGDWSKAWEGLKQAAFGVFEVIGGKIEWLVGLIGGIGTAIVGAAANVANFVSSGGKEIRMSNMLTYGSDKKSNSGLKIGANASGTASWIGGLTSINERGGEIVDLPRGTRIYPHDESLAMARNEGARSAGSATVTITGNTFNVRSNDDIEAIGDVIVRKLKAANNNRGGWTYNGAMA